MRLSHLFLIFSLLGLAACTKESPPAVEFIPKVKTLEIGEQAKGQVRRLSGKAVASESTTLSLAVSGKPRAHWDWGKITAQETKR